MISLAQLRTRALEVHDAEECAAWLAREEVLAPGDRRALAFRIKQWLGEERLQGAVIETTAPKRKETLAIGVSGFARPELVDDQLAEKAPFFLVRLLLRQVDGHPSLLDRKSVARANAGAGLDLAAHLMMGCWDFSNPLWRQVGLLAHQAYVQDHRGYQIRRAFQEDWQRDEDIYLASGYRLLHSVALPAQTDSKAPHMPRSRNLYTAEVSEVARMAPGSSVSFIMQWNSPQCRLTRAEQHLLLRAAEGLTDAQLADAEGVSPNTLKTIWRSIFERMRRYAPHVVANVEDDMQLGRRGPEVRRRVIAYVAQHPEELRPFDWTARDKHRMR